MTSVIDGVHGVLNLDRRWGGIPQTQVNGIARLPRNESHVHIQMQKGQNNTEEAIILFVVCYQFHKL